MNPAQGFTTSTCLGPEPPRFYSGSKASALSTVCFDTLGRFIAHLGKEKLAALAGEHGRLLGGTDPRRLYWLISEMRKDHGGQGTWLLCLDPSLCDGGQVT